MFFFLSSLYFAMTTRRRHEDLPYKSHPLYCLRRATIWTCIIGGVIALVAFGFTDYGSSSTPALFISAIFLLISFLFCLHDLLTYAAAKAARTRRAELPDPIPFNVAPGHDASNSNRNSSSGEGMGHSDNDDDDGDGDNPSWPSKRLIAMDAFLAVALFFLFWISIFAISEYDYYRRGDADVVKAYAALADLVASILHAKAFWKEFMARKKKAWKRSLKTKPCVECGFVNGEGEGGRGERAQGSDDVLPSLLSGLRPGSGTGTIKLPKWASLQQHKPQQQSSNLPTNCTDAEPSNPFSDNSSQSLLATPNSNSSVTDMSGLSSTIPDYGAMSRSTESLASVPETIVRKKEKGKGKGKRREVLIDTADLV